MDCGAGDRGVSEVVGFILVFGMLVIAFTVYQGIVVPDQNRQVEFQHNQAVHGQLQDLRNAIVTTAATGSGQAVSVTLGASYPRRAIALNLGVSGGSLQTTDAGSGSIRIENVRAIDGETDDYLDGNPHTFETKSITYTPVYTFYTSAPQTVYENSLLVNRFGGANVTLTDQVIVDGRRITLIAVNGSLTRAERDTVSISTEAISASSNRVAVTNTTDERINITIPSRLSAAEWEAVLEEEMGSDGYVRGVYDVPGEEAVNVSLKQAVTYEFRMAKVGVGGATDEESAEYLTAVGGDDESVAEGGTQKFVVEVRDRFNNPVSSVTVDASITQSAGTGEYVSPTTDTTGADGRATFTYAAPGNVDGAQEADVEVAFDDGGDASEIVTFDVEVIDADGSGGGGGGGGGGNQGGNVQQINPGSSEAVVLVSQSPISGSGDDTVTLTLENNLASEVDVTEARISFFHSPLALFGSDPTEAELYSDQRGVPSSQSETLEIEADFVSLNTPIRMNASTTSVVNLDFDDRITDEDFYILSLEFENVDNGDVYTYTYFVSHP